MTIDDFLDTYCDGFVTRRAADEVRAELVAMLADERQRCTAEAAEVAASFRSQGAHVDAWGAASVANYLRKDSPFGFVGPFKPWGRDGRPAPPGEAP